MPRLRRCPRWRKSQLQLTIIFTMNLPSLLFGKNLEEVTLNDVNNYFLEPKEESDQIEYKSYFDKRQNNPKEKEKAILKTVCAMLNSSGGMIIWGAPIEKKNKHGEKIYDGSLSPIDKMIDKDAFMAKIANAIIPAVDAVKFHRIDIGLSNCVLILQVGESKYKPHQFDNRYWMRLDGQSKVSPHHFIEALMKSVSFPNLEGYLIVKDFQYSALNTVELNGDRKDASYYTIELAVLIFNLSGLINEENIMFKLITSMGKFKSSYMYSAMDAISNDGKQLYLDNAQALLFFGEPYTSIETLTITNQDLCEHNSSLTIELYFGGKKSPQKISSYEIDIKSRDVYKVNTKQRNELIANHVKVSTLLDNFKKRGESASLEFTTTSYHADPALTP